MKPPLTSLVFSLLATTLCASLHAQTIYDHFDDGDRDGPEWDYPEFLQQFFTEAGSLHIVDGPPNQVHANMVSTQWFRGDFEIHMDWRDFSSSASSFVINDPSFGLEIQTFSSGEFVFIRRHLGPFGDEISTGIAVNGSGQQGGSAGTNAPAGLFKITRTGVTIETWYDVGSGWVMQDTIPNAFASDVRIQVSAYTGDDGIFHAATDWVSFLGTEILTNVGIKINGSDGPVSLAQGSQMDLTISMDPNQLAGFRGDWFIWVLSPFGPFWLNGSGVWVPSLTPVLGHQGPFFSLPSLTAFSSNTMPPGDYEFFIGVDPFPNGTIDDIDGFRWDVVHLAVF